MNLAGVAPVVGVISENAESAPMNVIDQLQRLLPGIVLCVAITIGALLLQWVEVRLVGQPYLEALVLAILIGVGIRSASRPGPRWTRASTFPQSFCLKSRS